MPNSEKKHVPVYCYQCVSGPDLMRVEVEDGVATRIESNWHRRRTSRGRAGLRQGVWIDPKDVQSAPRKAADEADQSEEGQKS